MVLFLVDELFLKIAIEITFTTDIFWSKLFSQSFLQPLFLNILCQDFPFRVLFGSSNDRLPAAAWLPGRPVNIRSWVSSLVSSWVLDFFKSWVKIQDLVQDLI